MINFNVVDLSERRSEEVISLFFWTLSVHVHVGIAMFYERSPRWIYVYRADHYTYSHNF